MINCIFMIYGLEKKNLKVVNNGICESAKKSGRTTHTTLDFECNKCLWHSKQQEFY